MKLISRTLIASAFAAFFIAMPIMYSDAPARVHLADAVGVILAFWIPALMVRSWSDLKARALFFAAIVVVGTIVWDVVSAQVVVKREFMTGAGIVYPLSLVGCFALFAIQTGLLKLFGQDDRRLGQ